MILAVLFLSIAPVFAADAPKGCDMKDSAKACCKADCCKKDAACCKDAKACDNTKDHSCKHAEGKGCSKTCPTKKAS